MILVYVDLPHLSMSIIYDGNLGSWLEHLVIFGYIKRFRLSKKDQIKFIF